MCTPYLSPSTDTATIGDIISANTKWLPNEGFEAGLTRLTPPLGAQFDSRGNPEALRAEVRIIHGLGPMDTFAKLMIFDLWLLPMHDFALQGRWEKARI